ncbi:hypothetical protein FXO37_26914 [Capsicum annuum]|nr:hypothetical protein FXO37_26914 [Capsicum annuum]
MFREMCSLGINSNEITLVGDFSAYSYIGKVKKGQEIFESINSKYQIKPGTAHYACMAGMFGKVGRLNEAMALINNMAVE